MTWLEVAIGVMAVMSILSVISVILKTRRVQAWTEKQIKADKRRKRKVGR